MKLRVPPPLIGLLCGLLIWLCYRYAPELNVSFPFQTVLAISLGLCGFSMDVYSVLQFFRKGTTVTPFQPGKASQLIVSGLYRFTRNPMYLGMLLMLVGWAIYCGNLVGLLGPLVFMALITKVQIRPEEEALGKKFGRSYDEYRKRVRRWL